MKISLTIVFLLGLALSKDIPNFYHSSEDINEQIDSVAKRCGSFITTSHASESPLIKEININNAKEKKLRAYLLFGEHPRELISPESGLRFLQDLCENQGSVQNQRILDNYEIRMILNANPLSRQKVEKGAFCLRENEHGVDLNRNYDAHWEQIQDDFKQVSSGPSPFSEPETQAIRNSLKNYGADVFLSVHSGTLGMYTPHAYSAQDGEFNEDNMIDVLERLQSNYCPSCDVGNAGAQVGYLSPGSCIDYAYDELKIKYSFAFEIYHQDVDLEQEVQQRMMASSFLQVQDTTANRKNRKTNAKKQDHASCFLQVQSKTQILMDDEDCFDYFNPKDSTEYGWYVQNWSNAMGDMLSAILDKESKPQ